MRRYHAILLGLVGTSLAAGASAQTTSQSKPANTKADIIAAMADQPAPAEQESDEYPLPGVTQKAFSLGAKKQTATPQTQKSFSLGGKKPAAAAQAPTTTQRFSLGGKKPTSAGNAAVGKPATAYRPGRKAPAAVTPRAIAYAPVLDMRVTFDLGSANLTEQGKAEARVFAEAMQAPEMAGKRFTVGGHTDAVGSRQSNLSLSRQRAQSVVDFLVAQGADRALLTPQGYGPDRPRSGLTARDPANRRVEFARAN